MFAPSLHGGGEIPKEFPKWVPERESKIAEVTEISTARESARFDFERVEQLRELVRHIDDDEHVQMDGYLLAELAAVFSPPGTWSLSQLSELQQCLFVDGELWMAGLLERASSSRQPIALSDSHLVIARGSSDFLYSTCIAQDCDAIGRHGAEDWLSLPLLRTQPPEMMLDHRRYKLETTRLGKSDRNERRAEEYEAEEIQLYTETLGQIFHTLSQQSRRVQYEAFALER